MTTASIVPRSDNTYPFGGASLRWTTIFATTGTINTSDASEKTLIDDGLLTPEGLLTPAGMQVVSAVHAVAYQSNAAIAEKGADKARIHHGWTSQMWQAAFVAAGLDPARFALWCADAVEAPVTTTVTRQRQKTATVIVSEPVITIVNGQAVQALQTTSVEQLQFETLQVVDPSGAPVMGPDGVTQATYQAPVIEDYEDTETALQPTGETRLGLRYDLCAILLFAYHETRIAALEAKVAALQPAP
jgi:hypothetical protein